MLGTAVVPWHLKHLHQKYLAETPMLSNIQKVLWFHIKDHCDQQMTSMQLIICHSRKEVLPEQMQLSLN